MSRDDIVDAMSYWSMAIGDVKFKLKDVTYPTLKNHTHPYLNCRCETTVPVDGQVKVKFNVDPKPFIHATIHTTRWNENKIDNLTPIYLTGDGSGVTFKKPKIKEEKKKMYEREDFKIVNGFSLYCRTKYHVKHKVKYLWLATDGELSEGGNKDYDFLTEDDAIKALDEFLESQNSELVLEYYDNDKSYGNVGDPTEITDLRGDFLFVGDSVELFNTKIGGSCGTNCVVEDFDKMFVMGVRGVDFKNGVGGDYVILKTKSYKDLKAGDNVGGIIVKEKTKTKELTIAEIEKELGFKVKVVGND